MPRHILVTASLAVFTSFIIDVFTASLFRYNVVSLLYFTCMLASVFLPSTAKKNDRSELLF